MRLYTTLGNITEICSDRFGFKCWIKLAACLLVFQHKFLSYVNPAATWVKKNRRGTKLQFFGQRLQIFDRILTKRCKFPTEKIMGAKKFFPLVFQK